METGTRPYANGGRTKYERLREAYDRAFHDLSSALKVNSGVAAAEQEYHKRRDALFQFLMNGTREKKHAPGVQHLAYVLWEQAGRPHGTAESDWYKAETLLAAG